MHNNNSSYEGQVLRQTLSLVLQRVWYRTRGGISVRFLQIWLRYLVENSRVRLIIYCIFVLKKCGDRNYILGIPPPKVIWAFPNLNTVNVSMFLVPLILCIKYITKLTNLLCNLYLVVCSGMCFPQTYLEIVHFSWNIIFFF